MQQWEPAVSSVTVLGGQDMEVKDPALLLRTSKDVVKANEQDSGVGRAATDACAVRWGATRRSTRRVW